MRDCVLMWRHTRMVTLTAVCAAIYAAVLIPTQAIPLIPGSTNLRPGAAVAVVLSLLFGPAAAWGVAFGNTLNDLFGTFGPGTWFGFAGNFLYALLPYKLWRAWGGGELPPSRWRGWIVFTSCTLVACAACAAVIAWGLHLMGLVPFAALAPIVFANNFLFCMLLGPPLLAALAPRVGSWGLRWEEIMVEGRTPPSLLNRVAGVVVGALALGALAMGLYLSAGLFGQTPFRTAAEVAGSVSLGLMLLPVLVLLLLAALLL